jgi:hypothetical protein
MRLDVGASDFHSWDGNTHITKLKSANIDGWGYIEASGWRLRAREPR